MWSWIADSWGTRRERESLGFYSRCYPSGRESGGLGHLEVLPRRCGQLFVISSCLDQSGLGESLTWLGLALRTAGANKPVQHYSLRESISITTTTNITAIVWYRSNQSATNTDQWIHRSGDGPILKREDSITTALSSKAILFVTLLLTTTYEIWTLVPPSKRY